MKKEEAMKKPLNEMTLVFWSRSANEGFSRAAAAAFFSQLDPTVEELADIKTAVSEAVTNCIVHAYRDTLGKIKLTARIYEGGGVYIQKPLFTTCETGERAGLGFAVMQSFMDKVSVRSAPGKGTTVTLRRTLSSRGADEPQPR